MTNKKPSPGPWSYDAEHGGNTFMVFNKDNFMIARHINSTPDSEGRRTVEEAEFNAKLICASEPMYELLKELKTFTDFYQKEHGVDLSSYMVFAKANAIRAKIEE